MKSETIKELKTKIRRLEKLSACYAKIIELVYDGEEIQVADRETRKLYKID